MSVQSPTLARPAAVNKPTGLYLMELRRRFTETHLKRQMLLVGSWTSSESQPVPILAKPAPRIEG